MLLVKGVFHHAPEEELLISGGGDGTIKLWSIDNLEQEGLMLLEKFKNDGLAVLSMAYSDTFLYVGFTNGKAHVYSLDSRQLVQKLDVRCGDIGAIQVIGSKAFCGGSGGYIKVLQQFPSSVKHH
jgi:di- and tripeptidase